MCSDRCAAALPHVKAAAQRRWPCACTHCFMKKKDASVAVEHVDSGRAPRSGPFSLETLKEHRLFRTGLWSHIRSARFQVILSVPLIYSCAVPFVLIDLWVAIFQSVCFPIYGIPKVRRRDYLIFDRGLLGYLNAIEKAGCIYCSYANGLIAYVAEVSARTEQRFCPIKHARPVAQPHSRYGHFLPYGDARTYRAQSETVSRDYGDLERRN